MNDAAGEPEGRESSVGSRERTPSRPPTGASAADAVVTPRLELRPGAVGRRRVLADLIAHRQVLRAMTRTDFSVRYKRAVFGILWAVALPLMQAAILAFVLAELVPYRGSGPSFAAYVLTGMIPWAYFAAAVASGATAVVDGAGLASKVWFPRVILPLVHPLAGLISLGISLAALLLLLPLLDVDLGRRLLLLVPAIALLLAFTTSLGCVFAALHVYFRDVRYIVQATLLVWFYATPVFYEAELLDRAAPLLDANPMTGIIGLFRAATTGAPDHLGRALAVSCAATAVLVVLAIELYRQLDRVLADRL